jgi:hypothetical protein
MITYPCPPWCESDLCAELSDDPDRCHQTKPTGERDELFVTDGGLVSEYLKVDVGAIDANVPPSIQLYLATERAGNIDDAHLDVTAATAREIAGWLLAAAERLEAIQRQR